jgi:hypothetical protein
MDSSANFYAHKQFSTTSINEGGAFKPMDLSSIMQKSGTASGLKPDQFSLHPYMIKQNLIKNNLPQNKERSRIVL